MCSLVFFFNAPPPPDPSTLSLHDALPISSNISSLMMSRAANLLIVILVWAALYLPALGSFAIKGERSEKHTSELQSQSNLVCRLLLEKKNKPARAKPSPRSYAHSAV